MSRFRLAPHPSPHLCARESGGAHLAFSRRGDVLDVGHGEELVVEVFVADIDGDWDAQLELPRELLFELGHGSGSHGHLLVAVDQVVGQDEQSEVRGHPARAFRASPP